LGSRLLPLLKDEPRAEGTRVVDVDDVGVHPLAGRPPQTLMSGGDHRETTFAVQRSGALTRNVDA
jgi:hypothetical protein